MNIRGRKEPHWFVLVLANPECLAEMSNNDLKRMGAEMNARVAYLHHHQFRKVHKRADAQTLVKHLTAERELRIKVAKVTNRMLGALDGISPAPWDDVPF